MRSVFTTGGTKAPWRIAVALLGLNLALGGCSQVRFPEVVASPGASARSLAPSRHSRFYVADHERGLTAASMGANQVEHQFAQAGGALSLAASPDGARLFACAPAGQLLALSYNGDLEFRVAVGKHPTCVVLSKDGKRAWVANQESQDLSQIDVTTRRELSRTPCRGGPFDLVLSPDQTRLWVSLHASGEVACLDAASMKELRRVPVGLAPYRMALDASGAALYIALFDQDEVLVLDTKTLTERGRIKTESGPYAVALDGADHVFVSNIEGGTVTVGRSSDLKVAPVHVPVGSRPHGLAVSADGQALYVAVEGESRVSVRATVDTTEKGSLALPLSPYEVTTAQLR
jgi:YVTN family beta-propeller protein